MSGWRDLAARLLRGAGAGVSPSLGGWLAAALAELPAIRRTGAAIGWVMSLGGMIAVDLLAQALFPWRREAGARPPSRFVALLGLALLAELAWRAATGGAPSMVLGLIAGLGVALSLWVNLGVVLKATPLGGLHYAVSARLLPLNLLVAGCATVLGVRLL